MDYHRRKLVIEFAPVLFLGNDMSLILDVLGITKQAATTSPYDDYWYNAPTSYSVAGVAVNAESALKLSAVWACVGLMADTVASLPLVVYRNLPNDSGKERARNHPLYPVLHRQPNDNQTAFEFWQMMLGHALLRGNGYARIVPGARGFVDQLIPLHPDDVQPEELTDGSGRLRYQIDGKPHNQEDIFHLRGLSLDGKMGLSVIAYARETMGISLAAERYGGRFFGNDSRPGGVLKTDRKLSEDAGKRLKSSWEAAHTGSNQHRVAVLEEGLEWQQIGISPEDAQFLETREFQAEDICRWFRVPPHMVGLTSKSTSWGSGIEQMSIGFATYTLRPWLVRIQQGISKDLILAPDTYFAEFIVEGLLQGDIATRYNAYQVGVTNGWLSSNEVRRKENMNDREGGDVYLTPLNMQPNNAETFGAAAPAHYRLLAEEAAGRLVRKERAALTKAAAKGEGWETAVSDFYTSHAHLICQTLRISLMKAQAYCDKQEAALLTVGLAALEDEIGLIAELADLAIGGTDE